MSTTRNSESGANDAVSMSAATNSAEPAKMETAMSGAAQGGSPMDVAYTP